jgi:hypothetical protein
MERMRIRGSDLWNLMKASPLRDRLLTLTMHGEDAPQAINRVELDPSVKDIDGLPVPRVTYANHKFEIASGNFYQAKLMDLLDETGVGHSFCFQLTPARL